MSWLFTTIEKDLQIFGMVGSGGGANDGAVAFCPSKPGLNPGTDLAFFGNAINLFSLGVGLYLKKTGHRKCYILFLLLSCFLSYKCVYINCIVPMNQRTENKNPPKDAGKGPYLKKSLFHPWQHCYTFQYLNELRCTSLKDLI